MQSVAQSQGLTWQGKVACFHQSQSFTEGTSAAQPSSSSVCPFLLVHFAHPEW